MGTSISQSPSPPHLYSQALQLKLYQAFIFSIPILFSVILFLLFYLFYLKRRAASFASQAPPILPTSSNQATTPIFMNAVCEVGLKGDLNDELPKIVFDEDIKARNSICCVCLGEFELKEELVQVPSCKHVFHVDCIRHWLCSNATCPLCRCFVVVGPHTTTQLMQLPLNILGNFQASNLQQQPQVREQVSNTSTTNTTIVGSTLSPASLVLQVQHQQ